MAVVQASQDVSNKLFLNRLPAVNISRCKNMSLALRSRRVGTMNFLSAILILAAILCSLFAIGFIALWLKGIKVIALPGLGLLLATPLIVLILLVVAVVTGILARISK